LQPITTIVDGGTKKSTLDFMGETEGYVRKVWRAGKENE